VRSHHHDDGASPDIGDALVLTFALPVAGAAWDLLKTMEGMNRQAAPEPK